jgi:hypothetical protein
MFRRSIGRPLRRALAGEAPPALRRANQLMAAGQYAAAAEIFEQFGRGALTRGGPRAPWLFLQAGRARVLAGQVPVGMSHFEQGLSLFAARDQLQQLHQTGNRLVAELKERGLAAEAQRLEGYLRTALPSGFTSPQAAGAGKPTPILPTNCTGCGAPIRSDEVDWVDEVTAECPYCGSAVRAEG